MEHSTGNAVRSSTRRFRRMTSCFSVSRSCPSFSCLSVRPGHTNQSTATQIGLCLILRKTLFEDSIGLSNVGRELVLNEPRVCWSIQRRSNACSQ